MHRLPAAAAQILPDQYLWFRSQNLKEAREMISSAYDSHQLEPVGVQRNVDVSLHVASLSSVVFSLVQYESDVVATVEQCSGIYVLMPLAGQLEVNSAGRRISCGPGGAIVQNAGMRFQKVMRNGYRQLVIKFDPDILLEHLQRLKGVATDSPIHFDATMDITGSRGASWWRTVNYVAEELRNADIGSPPELLNEPLERLLIQSILRCQPHNYSTILEAPRQLPLAPWYIKRAEEYLRSCYAEPVSLEDLAQTAGVSSRSLQYGFKKAYGVSPMQYLKDIRLAQVRSELLQAHSGMSVTSAAMACGFKQLGWFASQYKEKYGEAPSETLRRAVTGKPTP